MKFPLLTVGAGLLYSVRKLLHLHFVRLLLLLLLVAAGPARASFILEHVGSADPATEGFTVVSCCSSSTSGPLANDQGRAAWRITGDIQASQFDYTSGALTPAQLDDIAAEGFTLTLEARVLPNVAPPYTASSPVIIGVAFAGYNGIRWEIDLGLDSSGNTVAVLMDTIDDTGPGLSVESFGQSFTIAGNGYHVYQLLYDPLADNADFYIDGIKMFDDYRTSSGRFGNGLLWGNNSGGETHFSVAQLASGNAIVVPEPVPALSPLGSGVLGSLLLAFAVLGLRHRRVGSVTSA